MYVVGTLSKLFRWCHQIERTVMLEEVILSEQTCYLHFDIEIKRAEEIPLVDFADILEEHLKLIGLELSRDRRINIAQQYKDHIITQFSEEECMQGITWILQKLKSFMFDHLGVEQVASFRVLSGCRRRSFRFMSLTRIYD